MMWRKKFGIVVRRRRQAVDFVVLSYSYWARFKLNFFFFKSKILYYKHRFELVIALSR